VAEDYEEIINQARKVFKKEVWSFLDRTMKTKYGVDWQEKVKDSLRFHRKSSREIEWDTQAIIDVVIDRWYIDFNNGLNLKRREQALLFRIREDIRNNLAHEHQFTLSEVFTGLEDIQRFLKAIKSPEIEEIEKLKDLAKQIIYKEFGKPAETLSAQPKVVENIGPTIIPKAKPIARVSPDGLDARPAFINNLVNNLKKEYPGLTDKAGPAKDPYWSFGSGRSGFNYGWAFRPNGTLVAEVYIDPPNSKPKAAFNALKKQQSEIEKQFGKPLIWQLNEGKRASRVYTEVIFTITDSSARQEEVKNWAIDSLLKLVEVFQKRIINLEF